MKSAAKEIEDTAAARDDADPVSRTMQSAVIGAEQTSDKAFKDPDENAEGAEQMLDAPVEAQTE